MTEDKFYTLIHKIYEEIEGRTKISGDRPLTRNDMLCILDCIKGFEFYNSITPSNEG